MENASKALLIAGGIALTMLVIALLLFMWGRFSSFYNSEDALKDVEDVAKFNSQFTNYTGEDVKGYELISLANKVADYNNRYSNATNSQNSLGYKAMKMTILLNGKAENFKYTIQSIGGLSNSDKTAVRRAIANRNSYFNQNTMEQSSVKNDIEQMINDAMQIELHYGSTDTASKLAKSIGSLILTTSQIEYNKNARGMSEEQSCLLALADYNSIAKSNQKTKYSDMVKELVGITGNMSIMKYYEYYQFKKGIFKCTKLSYDNVSNRVDEIEFTFTGNME